MTSTQQREAAGVVEGPITSTGLPADTDGVGNGVGDTVPIMLLLQQRTGGEDLSGWLAPTAPRTGGVRLPTPARLRPASTRHTMLKPRIH
jgi:hypothetical protein